MYIEGNINIYIVVIYVGGGGIYVMKIWIMYMACLLYAYVDIQIIVGIVVEATSSSCVMRACVLRTLSCSDGVLGVFTF